MTASGIVSGYELGSLEQLSWVLVIGYTSVLLLCCCLQLSEEETAEQAINFTNHVLYGFKPQRKQTRQYGPVCWTALTLSALCCSPL